MIRELAGYDVSRYETIADWPLVEALLAYEARMIARAEREYREILMRWSGLGPPPKRPAILEEA